jgi:hypothetical protein
VLSEKQNQIAIIGRTNSSPPLITTISCKEIRRSILGKKALSYSDHLETLIALLTHLAMTDWSMRSAPNLSKALSIEESEIEYVLENFKGLFRKSKTKKSKANFYALQIRHARQWLNEEESEDENTKKPPLESEHLTALLDFVIRKAEQEKNHSHGFITAWIAAGAALIVAILAIIFTGKCS